MDAEAFLHVAWKIEYRRRLEKLVFKQYNRNKFT